MTWAQLSRLLYLASRAAGDASAASRGGAPALARRVARRRATRAAWRLLR